MSDVLKLEGRPLRKEVLLRELSIMKRQLQTSALKEIMDHHHIRMTEELFGQLKLHNADFFDIEAVPETGE